MHQHFRRLDSRHIAQITENPPGRFSFVVLRGENRFDIGGGHAFEPQTFDDALAACHRIVQRNKQSVNLDLRTSDGLNMKWRADRDELRRERRKQLFSKVANAHAL